MEINGDLDSEAVAYISQPNLETRERSLGFKVYKRRWFILSVVCILNSSNAMVCNLRFAPIIYRVTLIKLATHGK